MKHTVYIVIDEISDLGTKVFFSRTVARNYSKKIVKAWKKELSENPYMSKEDKEAPITEDEYGDFHYHGSHAWIIEGVIDLPPVKTIYLSDTETRGLTL